jgi:NAD(P)H-dependent FMN reductase
MLQIAVVLGSTRPQRRGEAVARWVLEQLQAQGHADARFVPVDLADVRLPLLDEPVEPSQGHYRHEHTRRWAELVAGFDAFVFVTPEYNHGPPAALKNALDFIYREWNDKAAAFVSYGSAGGSRAVEQLRQVMGELQVAVVRAQLMLSLHTDWQEFRDFRPAAHHGKSLANLAEQLIAWGGALQQLRRRREQASASSG